MGKVHKASGSECYAPLSEPFSANNNICISHQIRRGFNTLSHRTSRSSGNFFLGFMFRVWSIQTSTWSPSIMTQFLTAFFNISPKFWELQ
jgi:hypothetical protein